MNQKLFSAVVLVTVGFVLAGVACKRDEPKPLRGSAPSLEARQQMLEPPLPAGHPPIDNSRGNPHTGDMPTLPPPAAPGAGEALAWDLPKGWTEAKSGGMRFATLKPAETGKVGKVDVSVIMLPGSAGGELANVNRWRGQVGLPAIDEAGRLQMRKAIKSKAGEVSLYDFTGTGAEKQRMVAGLLFVDGRSWFLKMTGDPETAGAARADFVKVLESLHTPAGK
jgi:hypothetical protein